ncbi:hypothetical protein BD289DRAFT_213161 [Coniella lustricola]|uniref:Secreted protein n=1 Tax=Coniella lustricola TaxID=2025994 RepID=A0A2T3ABP3_9PEZI|nr:hypothetical protein BD289DRAFT_213161 [Coniella lustricola]
MTHCKGSLLRFIALLGQASLSGPSRKTSDWPAAWSGLPRLRQAEANRGVCSGLEGLSVCLPVSLPIYLLSVQMAKMGATHSSSVRPLAGHHGCALAGMMGEAWLLQKAGNGRSKSPLVFCLCFAPVRCYRFLNRTFRHAKY